MSSLCDISDESKNMLVSGESIPGLLARLENAGPLIFTRILLCRKCSKQ